MRNLRYLCNGRNRRDWIEKELACRVYFRVSKVIKLLTPVDGKKAGISTFRQIDFLA